MKKNIRQGIQLGLCALVMACTACSERDKEPLVEAAGSGESSQPAQESDMNVVSIGEILTRQAYNERFRKGDDAEDGDEK